MSYRLALDLGSTSLGWSALSLDNGEVSGLMALGVRVYDDGRDSKTKEPTAVSRRIARGARRNRDRKKGRVNRLRARLVELGVFPKDEILQKQLECKDPYDLRSKALDEKLEIYDLGRAFLHMAQRRGFKSNRKSDKGNSEAGPVKEAAAKLKQQMEASGARTLGEYLNKCQVKRVRRQSDGVYSIYPYRSMYEEEFDKMIHAQQQYHPHVLTEQVIEEIRNVIFFQRNLHKPKVGYCSLEFKAREPRAALALPMVQEFRIYQEVANLDFERYQHDDPHMSVDQKKKIAHLLNTKAKITFKRIRKELKVDGMQTFNLETDARRELKGNDTTAKLSHKKAFGSQWLEFSLEKQTEIVTQLLEQENEQELVKWLIKDFGLNPDQAEHISNIHLADGYGRLSVKAIEKILPYLKQGKVYSDACQEAGYDHSDRRTGEIFDQLPYYGEVLSHRVIPGSNDEIHKENPELFYGKVNNPTVHIMMNQLRKLVNEAIRKWGHPESITVELARDLKTPAQEINKVNARNRKDNERIAEELNKLDVKNNYANRMRYKLWEDLSKDPISRCCPFTGKIIAAHAIFSPEFEVEHLIPFSRSFDDGRGNKVLALRSANRAKGNRTPFEAFGSSPVINGQRYQWDEIQARADGMPNKRWRFRPDAMEKIDGKEDILARQLNDTRYLSRLAKEYLQFACDPNHIITIPGKITAMVRRKWRLEDFWEDGKKNRQDHRHHALDAFTVGCISRRMLHRISSAALNLEKDASLQDKRDRLVSEMPLPYDGYWEDVHDHFSKMVISHKPDHGNASKAIKTKHPYTVGKLHEDTAYGLVHEDSSKGKNLYVTRKSVDSLETIKHVETVADTTIRKRFVAAVEGLKDKSKEFKEALEAEATSKDPKIYRVRCHIEKSKDVMIGILNKKTQKAYKYYQGGSNAYTEIFMPLFGKDAGIWKAETISQYAAHNSHQPRKWKNDHPTAKLIMRLHNHDMVAYEKDGRTIIAKVKKMSGGKIWLRPHHIAVEEADKESWEAYPRKAQEKNLRKISVDILGQVKDPKKDKGH